MKRLTNVGEFRGDRIRGLLLELFSVDVHSHGHPLPCFVDRRLGILDLDLIEESLGVDAHRLLGLHVALSHRCWRNRVASKDVHKLLVINFAITISVASSYELVDLCVSDRNVPQVQCTPQLFAIELA